MGPTLRNFDLVSGVEPEGMYASLTASQTMLVLVGQHHTLRLTVLAGCVNNMVYPQEFQHSLLREGLVQGDQTRQHLLFDETSLTPPHKHGLWISFNDIN